MRCNGLYAYGMGLLFPHLFPKFSHGQYIRMCGIRLHASCTLMDVPLRGRGMQAKYDDMKRMLLSMLMLYLISAVVYGQQEVTKFLGIPVDGSKSKMVRQLKKKGFKRNFYTPNVLFGEFNGMDVNVHIATTKQKVSRIMICDVNHIDEAYIKTRFNILCAQFEKNNKYLSVASSSLEYIISDNEDISYEMSANDKRYEAVYYQLPTGINRNTAIEDVQSFLRSRYTEEELKDPQKQAEIGEAAFSYKWDKYAMRMVWFIISEYSDKYYITMFYDNEYNRITEGEDL